MAVQRGEIYFVDPNPVPGREQAGRRPVLVLSIDAIASPNSSTPFKSSSQPFRQRMSIRSDFSGCIPQSYSPYAASEESRRDEATVRLESTH